MAGTALATDSLRKDSGTAGSPTNVMPGHALGFEWFAEGTTTTYELEGDECLVFFLGGIAQISGSDIVLHGFAHRPENPSGVPSSAIPDSQKRTQAFYTFDAGRLFVRTGTNVETLPTSEAEVDFATAANHATSQVAFVSRQVIDRPVTTQADCLFQFIRWHTVSATRTATFLTQ